MQSCDNQGHQYRPHELQYLGYNLLVPEMMDIAPHGMSSHWNNCLVDVVRKFDFHAAIITT